MRVLTAWAVLLLAILAACNRSDTTQQESEATASARIQAIPEADPAKYRGIRDMSKWQNPYLIIQPNGIGLLDPENNEQHILKPDEVLPALAALPASAWPYGRVVVVAERAAGASEEEKVAVRRTRGIVGGTLKSANVVVNWVPST